MATSLSASLLSLPAIPASRFSSDRNPKFFSCKKSTLSIVASASSNRNGSSPETDCPVPLEQQPVNEYQALSTSFPFSWAAADISVYYSRLAFTGSAFALFVGLPVAAFRNGSATVVNIQSEWVHLSLGAASAGIFAVTLAVVRMYLGWAYVGNRLLSATVEYEETGWYDGQVWVKTPEVLARDRLLGSFTVKPVLNRIKLTLVGLAITLAFLVTLFINTDSAGGQQENLKGRRAVPGVYNDAAARSFEPDAFYGESDLS